MARPSDRGSGIRLWIPVLALTAVLLVVVAAVRMSRSPEAAPHVAPPSPSPIAAPVELTRVALFLGDSYTAGVGASSGAARWTSLVATEAGWLELNVGRAGTGYLAEPPPEVCGYSICPAYPTMALRVSDEQPDVVVVSGGQNDTMLAHTYWEFEQEAIAATFDTIREAAPEALLVALGPKPIWGVTPTLLDIEAEVRSAVEARCGVFVSLLDPPVLEPEFLLEDGIHVGDEGHAAIAARVLDTLARHPGGTCGASGSES